MNRIFILLCICMSLICMFSCATTLAWKTQGLPVVVFGMSANPSLVAGLLMLFAILFLFLAARVAFKLRKK